ncbi:MULTISPECIES: NADP(H)-dependent aldo-keto reductase [unclassified Coleofasciculus]|uniref:NADP(H)-dependent aldo-keto reductase n=1 Tax=unclassified Coleofasciculus TaxID=2692782 RepID=UPI001880ECDE|nr:MULTISPECIES: NADP(H)-dependent aldo-keto reductase [unclassified Coleofasciculus]MBE9126099.1 NADP(H)-dependent aldo-keto reductase [Coleofasciculus sp. LEGE 07081]MBE9147546.1 NADP(H)-dependent aldo-keto reductase [Coleofasciculus sp. LEGE 07092]
MEYKKLGDSDLLVSEICLGTMTYGQQNTVEDASEQLDYAVSQGVNFIDTAEMYPVPGRAETQGKTEEYIGQWLVKQQRDKLIIATKIAGPTSRISWIREGKRQIDRPNIEQAVEDSLKRLQTDYIDLYQIHWPDRYVPLFGAPNYDPKHERETVPIAEQLEVFADLIKAGKIRYLGLSNETPWGVCEFCHVAKQLGLPKGVSIQNAYSLVNRVFDIHLSEACRFNNVGLLAYSPLAFGFLTGKYLNGIPENSRVALFSGFGQRYEKSNLTEAVKAYIEIAQKHNLTPAQLALAFVRSRWFVTSTIIGATTMEQLKENLSSGNVTLDKDILAEIDAVHARYPNPTP